LKIASLPNGSIVSVVDVKAVRVHKHFLRSDKFYVAIEFRNGTREDIAEQLTRQAAEIKKAEITDLVHDAWQEVDPYEFGRQAGSTEGRAVGWAEGFAAGHSEGYQNGRDEGCSEGRRFILWRITEWRENLLREQCSAADLPPSRRRYLRDAISVLSEVIQFQQ
jgi:hypothetical protein